MSSPTTNPPIWGSDTNFSSGPDSGEPVKVAPSAGVLAQGFVPGFSFLAAIINYVLYWLSSWVEFFRAESDTSKFGDGSDGTVTLGTAGTTTLSRDMFYQNLTISHASRIVQPQGYRIFVSDTLTLSAGRIENDGANAVDDTAGAGGLSGSLLGGGNGAAGPVLANTAGTQAAALVWLFGGTGGAGGADGGGESGGAAQTGTAPPANDGSFRSFPGCVELRRTSTVDQLGYRAGGGAGGSSGANDAAGGGQHGGGGGGGGGVIVIVARRLILSAGTTIRANGGNGGTGFNTVGAGAGGGGGGGGGVIVIIAREVQDAGATVQVNGGSGGAGDDAGSAGSAGSAGKILRMTG